MSGSLPQVCSAMKSLLIEPKVSTTMRHGRQIGSKIWQENCGNYQMSHRCFRSELASWMEGLKSNQQ